MKSWKKFFVIIWVQGTYKMLPAVTILICLALTGALKAILVTHHYVCFDSKFRINSLCFKKKDQKPEEVFVRKFMYFYDLLIETKFKFLSRLLTLTF